jgi:hypothetical protein
MKTILKAVMMTSLAVAGFGAQPMAKLKVGFPFVVGKTKMPAGEYRISIPSNGVRTLKIESMGTGPAAFLAVPVQDLTRDDQAGRKVEFVCEGQECKISRIFNLDSGYLFSTGQKVKATSERMIVKLNSGSTKTE